MNKKKKINRVKVDTVRSVNNNIRSSVRKLNKKSRKTKNRS